MRSFRQILLSAICLLLAAGPLFAQSADEGLGQLPLNMGPFVCSDTFEPVIAPSFVLPEGTQVSLEFATYISTRTAKRSDRVRFRVVSDVSVEGMTVISKGAEAWGTVTLAKKPGHFSRDGKLQIALQSAILLNGQTIAIRVPAPARTQTGKWDLREPDSLQVPLLGLLAPVLFVAAPREDQRKLVGWALGGMIAKGDHDVRVPGMRIEAEISHATELNRLEFNKLQAAARGSDTSRDFRVEMTAGLRLYP